MKWLIVRHGETDWNRTGRIQGQSDTPLNERGRGQARALGAALREVPIVAAYCSDLARAQGTAELMLGDRPVALNATKALREMNFGGYEGLTVGEVGRRDSGMFMERRDIDPDIAPPEGESFVQVYQRVSGFVRATIGAGRTDTVLVVAHNGSVRALLLNLLALPLTSFGAFQIAGGSLAIVECQRGRNVLKVYNHTAYDRT